MIEDSFGQDARRATSDSVRPRNSGIGKVRQCAHDARKPRDDVAMLSLKKVSPIGTIEHAAESIAGTI
jgi:hypothetical protein